MSTEYFLDSHRVALVFAEKRRKGLVLWGVDDSLVALAVDNAILLRECSPESIHCVPFSDVFDDDYAQIQYREHPSSSEIQETILKTIAQDYFREIELRLCSGDSPPDRGCDLLAALRFVVTYSTDSFGMGDKIPRPKISTVRATLASEGGYFVDLRGEISGNQVVSAFISFGFFDESCSRYSWRSFLEEPVPGTLASFLSSVLGF
jgi:hypothetical protein